MCLFVRICISFTFAYVIYFFACFTSLYILISLTVLIVGWLGLGVVVVEEEVGAEVHFVLLNLLLFFSILFCFRSVMQPPTLWFNDKFIWQLTFLAVNEKKYNKYSRRIHEMTKLMNWRN